MAIMIRMQNVPPGSPGAFLPGITTTPAASSGGEVRTTGSPGTTKVPVPKPHAIPLVATSEPRTNPSYVAPDFILPSIYVSHADHMHPPGAILADNYLPVQSINYGRSAVVSGIKTQRLGGRTVTANPRAYVTWPVYGGRL